MDQADIVIGAFSEEHAAAITGVSRNQLRWWDGHGFFRPSYAYENRRSPYSRVYSFKDLVALQVLNELRNEHGISLQHLRQVARKLAHLGDDRWTATTLYVLGKRVVFEDPRTKRKREIVSGQYVVDIPLRVVVRSTRKAIAHLNKRDPDDVGRVVRLRFVSHNEPVVAGTRVAVASIKAYADAGYSPAEIVKEYPDLTTADVAAALAYGGNRAAA